jgi:hypothetical protein
MHGKSSIWSRGIGYSAPKTSRWEATMLKRRRFFVLGLLVLLAVLFVGARVLWYARNRTGSYSTIMHGGRSSIGNVSISHGNLFLVSGKPAVLFSTVTKPDHQEELCYVLIFRPLPAAALAGLGPSFNSGTSSEGRKHESHVAIAIDGRRIEARYEVDWNETYTKVTREALAVGGQSQDLNSGKVFLIDLTGQAPVYIQKNLKLMPQVAPLGSPADVERLGEAILRSLENQDAETKVFIR